MAEYFVADTYKNWTRGKEFERSGKPYCMVSTICGRCGGNGMFIIPGVFQGTCYACNGAGKQFKEVRLYTEKEYNAMQERNEKNREAKAAAEAARQSQLVADSEKNKAEVAAKLGFAPDYTVFIAFGDVYAQRSELKALGCRYNEVLGWYSANAIDAPEGVNTLQISIDEVYDWIPTSKRFVYVDHAIDVVKNKIDAAVAETSKSEYIGEIGCRFRNLIATLKNSFSFDGSYGTTNVYNFTVGDSILTWMTTSFLDIEVGSTVELSATVKSHEIYKGEKITKITRAKVTTAG